MLSNKIIGTAKAVEPVYIEDFFSTYLHTGNGSAQTITNGIDLAGEGGLVWLKERNNSRNHGLFDTSRGVSYRLSSNTTEASTSGSWLSSFNSNGFSLGGYQNSSGSTYVSWTFRKAPRFFDVVTYTGTGSAQTIAHNLGSVPGCIIVKSTSGSTAWAVYHTSLGATGYIELNGIGGAGFYSQPWNSTAPTATGFTVGTAIETNTNGATFVAYIFAHDPTANGVIQCGSYTTDASGNATVNLGYEPQWFTVKRTNDTSNWDMYDNMRGISTGGNEAVLRVNLLNAEISADTTSLTSTGFITAGSASSTYIYIAIRRGPMKVPTDGTKVFAPFNTSVASNPQSFTTNFPVDFAFTRKSNGNAEQIVTSKLQGGYYMDTTNTNVEQTVSYYKFDSNTSVISSYHNPGFGTVQSMLAMRRAPGFMDVVCYTGTGVVRAVPHNLGVAPELIIVKGRNQPYLDWMVYHAALGNTKAAYLRSATTPYTYQLWWDNTSPTASVYTVGTDSYVNQSAATYIAYLFATCAGVSKVGSYTGTGTTQAINCGFTAGARFVMIKRTDLTGDWYYWDSARGIVSGNDPYLLMNSALAEVTGTDYIDPSSAGFEISSTAPAEINASGGSYIFLAVA